MIALRSLSATSSSFFSIAALTRPISRLLVSPPAASQSAQMRFSTYLALSSVGAILSASNSLSILILGSPACGRGRLAGGSTSLGSGFGPIGGSGGAILGSGVGSALGSVPSGGLTSGPWALGAWALGAWALGAWALGACASAYAVGTVVSRAATNRAWNRLAMVQA